MLAQKIAKDKMPAHKAYLEIVRKMDSAKSDKEKDKFAAVLEKMNALPYGSRNNTLPSHILASLKGGARRTRRTRCWSRKRRNGSRYTVCNRSRGQKSMYKKKRKTNKKGGARRTRRTRCWSRKRRNGSRYTVCNRSRGQKAMYKKKRKTRKARKN